MLFVQEARRRSSEEGRKLLKRDILKLTKTADCKVEQPLLKLSRPLLNAKVTKGNPVDTYVTKIQGNIR